MKVVIAPDKFKGSLSASEVCDAIEIGLNKKFDELEIIKLPLADGGEGTLDAIGKRLGLEPVILEVRDPLYRPAMATYHKNDTQAFIEMAMASGLQLLAQDERNCMYTTTYGTGELIVDAIRKGVSEIYLFVGGSATNDAGIGMASALGYQFYNELGEPIRPVGECLVDVHDYELVDPQFVPGEVKFHVITDVKNKFYGPEGAAHVYGPQKGANEVEVKHLDAGLKNFAEVVQRKLGITLQEIDGSGAAGGLGGGGLVFLDANVQSGIDSIMDLVGFETHLEGTDLIITGEGRFDDQTLHGKVIEGVARKARVQDIPIIVFCGVSEVEEQNVKALGISQVIALVDAETSVDKAIKEAYQLLPERVSLIKM